MIGIWGVILTKKSDFIVMPNMEFLNKKYIVFVSHIVRNDTFFYYVSIFLPTHIANTFDLVC